MKADEVVRYATERFEEAVADLSAYLRIPAISCDPAHHADVRALAEKIRGDLAAVGMQQARVLDLPGALPCVAAEWMGAGEDAPTVLIYGHLDLQPVKGERWNTPPHEPTRIGERLYARGAADDMGGWVSHLAALKAWIIVAGGPPCNVRLLIEGEEEIGSPNLERFMDAYPDAFAADVMVLTDCENPSTEVPGLTVSLRGLLEGELRCTALEADVHSGLWGNVAPDPVLAVMQLVSRLLDEDGRLKLGRVQPPADWAQAAWDVPLTEDVIRGGAHLAPGVAPLPHRGRSPAEWIWRQPAVTVVAATLPTPDRKKNAVRAEASAILSFRVAPGQTGAQLRPLVEELLLSDPPGGVRVDLTWSDAPGGSWLYEPKGPAFEAADRAYQRAWGAPLQRIGVGGSIPFVAIFGERFGGLPLILNGVMDPQTTAHGPNESLHLGVFRKAIAANVLLLAELSSLSREALRGG